MEHSTRGWREDQEKTWHHLPPGGAECLALLYMHSQAACLVHVHRQATALREYHGVQSLPHSVWAGTTTRLARPCAGPLLVCFGPSISRACGYQDLPNGKQERGDDASCVCGARDRGSTPIRCKMRLYGALICIPLIQCFPFCSDNYMYICWATAARTNLGALRISRSKHRLACSRMALKRDDGSC